MKKLSEVKWREFSVLDIFDVYAGIRLTKDDMVAGKRPFIGATDSNNGITAFCGNINKSLDSNVLGVNYNGSVVENFYHPYEAIFSDDVKRLKLKEHTGNKYIYLFIKNLILKQKEKFQYGYKFNGERMGRTSILMPVNEGGQPDYDFMEQYMMAIEKKLLKRYQQYLVDTKRNNLIDKKLAEVGKIEWKAIDIRDVFSEIKRGRRLKTENHITGTMPYVSSSATNNGVDDFVSNNQGVRIFCDCISLANSGSVGASFYHPYKFVASDHVTKLKGREFNKFSYLFLASITSRLSEKYSYNREINESRINREKILVPITSDGQPDYEYMEQYMKAIEHRLINRYIEKRLKTL